MARRKSENYKKCWEYLKKSKYYFLFIVFLLIVSILAGFFYPVFFQAYIQNLIKKLAEQTSGMDFFQLLVFIFKNNLIASFLGMILGLLFGLYPVVLGFLNGYVLGFVAGKTAGVLGYSSLLKLVPHGVFEIPALIISLGLGLKLGMFIFSGNKKKYLKENFQNSLRVFVYVTLPLLLIAGIIETLLIFIL